MTVFVLALAVALDASQPAGHAPSARVLMESGRYQEAVEAARAQGSPDATYIAALASLKADQADGAREAFTRLREGAGDDSAWHAIGAAGLAQLDGNSEGALEHARRAVTLGPDAFAAHYELGLVLNALDRHAEAAAVFDRAAAIDPSFAYAHYYAGLAYQKEKRIDKMASHFEYFLKLAPSAPEVPAVQSIMRTVRGR